MSEFRNVSAHAQPLASGRILAPGDAADLDLDNEHDNALVNDGALVPVETKTTKKESR